MVVISLSSNDLLDWSTIGYEALWKHSMDVSCFGWRTLFSVAKAGWKESSRKPNKLEQLLVEIKDYTAIKRSCRSDELPEKGESKEKNETKVDKVS